MSKKFEYSASMNRLIEQLARLPGIGRRTAERLAFHILKTDKEEALGLAAAITDVKTNVHNCSVCYNLTETDPCPICADPRRDPRKILVVEQPKDVIILEQAHSYDGLYHVLLGHLSPLEGIGPDNLTIHALIERVKGLLTPVKPDLSRPGEGPDQPVEVILGTNPNMEGDGTALYTSGQLARIPGGPVHISRLARGLPVGTQLEYSNKAVLSDAITARQPMA
jgi:recombination protein RecR